MSMMNNTSTSGSSIRQSAPVIPFSIQFWIYLIFDVLSIPCSLLILYYFFFDRTLRKSLHNHVIIVLLCIGLIYESTYIPWTLYHRYHGVPWIQQPLFYLFTYFFDYGSFSAQIILFGWATIERHILIFHDQWLSTRTKRLFLHYFPIIVIILYRLLYLSINIFGSSCENRFDSFISTGNFAHCAFSQTLLGTFELSLHQVTPTCIIIIFSIALVYRIIRQKRRLNQAIHWRRHRKMTVQLLSITLLYMMVAFPWTIVTLSLRLGLPSQVSAVLIPYTLFLRAFVIFLYPYVCLTSLPELRMKIRHIASCWDRRERAIAPHTVTLRPVSDAMSYRHKNVPIVFYQKNAK